jgi:hypothetical protein
MVVAVPAKNVPDVSVIVPFRVSAVVLPPTLKVFADLLTVTLLKVCVDAVPLIACAVPLLNVTVLDPGLNVPPLFIQSPAMLMAVAVPAENVPDVNVTSELIVRVVVLPPTLNICPALFTVRLLNVCDIAVPLIACAAVVLTKFTVLAPTPGVNMPPLLVQSPEMSMVIAVPAEKVPDVSVMVPFKARVVVLPPTLKVFADLLTVTLLKVCVDAVPLIACAVPLLNVTVLAPGLNVPPLFIQSPEMSIAVAVPAKKFPAASVKSELSVNDVVLPPTLRV